MKAIVIIFAMLLGSVGFGGTSLSNTGPLQIWSDYPTTTVFFGTVVDENGERISGPGFVYGPINLSWNGADPLQLMRIVIKIPAAGHLQKDFVCTFDGDSLRNLFPPLGNPLVIPPGTVVNGGSVICVGLKAKNKSVQFMVEGQASIKGFTRSNSHQKLFTGSVKLPLYWFPEESY